jgi:signal transduction histidine kinase
MEHTEAMGTTALGPGGLAEEQAALRRVATLVANGASSTEVFDAVAQEVAQVLHLLNAAVCRYADEGATMTVLAVYGDRPGSFKPGSSWQLDGPSMSAEVLRTGRPARVENYTDLRGSLAAAAREGGFSVVVGVPIIVDGRVWGVVSTSSPDAPLPDDLEDRLAEFTELVATAIANGQAHTELEASRARIVATADATRRRIERDLHDGAQQQLVSVALELRAVQDALPLELHELRAALARTLDGLTSVLHELREIGQGIHPAILTEGGLGPALKTLARRSALPVELDVPAEVGLPERVEVAAYYVVSEALTNAAKHARASVVRVAVRARDNMLEVSVRDDGLGGADPSRGSGLLGLKDRAEAIGGTLSLESTRGAGTFLYVELPLDDLRH